MEGVDAEVLISLVEAKPVLWDKTLEIYKDRNATRKAWEEVCVALNPDFENNDNGEKYAFGKEVVKRWTNLRDCFAKSKKDDKSAKKSGSGVKKRKKYVFSDQLQFLNKIYTKKETVDSFNPEIVPGTLEEDEEPEGTTGDPKVSTNVNLPSKPVGTRKRMKPDEVEVKMLKALEHKTPCSKMSFLQSLMPHLTNYTNSEFLQFQVGVLNVIENINKLKETPHLQSNNPSSAPSYQPQPQNMLQPFPVNQPQAFVHVQQPPFQSQQYANPSFSGYVQNSAQQLHFSQYVREQQNQARPKKKKNKKTTLQFPT